MIYKRFNFLQFLPRTPVHFLALWQFNYYCSLSSRTTDGPSRTAARTSSITAHYYQLV